MRAFALLTPLLFFACSPPANTFETRTFNVQAPGATSAELQLCGMTTHLEPSGQMFTATRTKCEGEGVIIVRFADQPTVICPVYQEPFAYQAFGTEATKSAVGFEIDNGRCLVQLTVVNE